MATLLCVDDDPDLADLLRFACLREGFTTLLVATARDGLGLARTVPVDLVLLDADLPDRDGVALLVDLCASSSIPVILLSTRGRDEDVIAGMTDGADDYVVKPFSMQVLMARVNAVLRRRALSPAALRAGRVENARVYDLAAAPLDVDSNELMSPDGTRVRLTPTEVRILQVLLTHPGQVLSAARILEQIHEAARGTDANVIKTHVRHLRAKMLQLAGHLQPIHTVPGVGYVVHLDTLTPRPASDHAGADNQPRNALSSHTALRQCAAPQRGVHAVMAPVGRGQPVGRGYRNP